MAATESSRVAAIVLAAGLSTRMGSSKPLLQLGGKALLTHVVDALIASKSVGPIVVITGHEAERVQQLVVGREVMIAHNSTYANGEMLSSIKTGLKSLPTDVDATLLALCDQPMVAPSTVASIVSAWRARQPRILLPKHRGKRGHPIVLSAIGFGEILSLSPESTLKAYTLAHVADTIELEVDDDAVTRDIDTPADFEKENQRRTGCI